jgi:hypothetical protein
LRLENLSARGQLDSKGEPGTSAAWSGPRGAPETDAAGFGNSFRRFAALAAAPAVVILAVTSASVAFFYARGVTNLYGDAIAHMEGARRLTDSLTPGLAEIGSVWLPLYHILVAPLAVNSFLWRTGLGGTLVSASALALGAWFTFRLGTSMGYSRAAGWVALAGFLGCANMLYVGSTPLTEPLCILWAVMLVWELHRYQHNGRTATLAAASLAAFFGTLTRYDGWYVLPFAAFFVLLAGPGERGKRIRGAILFCAIAGAGPLLWALHNWHRFGNPLEFYNGPYSAEAIYAHQLATTGFRYPTDGSLTLSARYYLEDVKLVTGSGSLMLAALGFTAWAADARMRARRSAALLLLVPFIFYAQSMAHSAIPIYVPTLFPHTYYNLRYGLEMLPAVALWPSFLVGPSVRGRVRMGTLALMGTILAVQFGWSIRGGAGEIATVKESLLNTPCHARTEEALTDLLRRDYWGETILMGIGKYPCVLPALGIPFRKTLTESNRPYWTKLHLGPAAWPQAPPFSTLEWIFRSDGDPVDELMRAYPDAFREFRLVETYRFPGEDTVRVYRRERGGATRAPNS